MNAKSFTYQKGRQELINWYIEITPNTSTASTSLQQQQHYPTAASAHSSLGGQSTPMHPQDRLRNGPPSSSSSSISSLPPSYQHHLYISDDDITKQALFNLSSMVPMDSYTTVRGSVLSLLPTALTTLPRRSPVWLLFLTPSKRDFLDLK
jgi:hypothetical protein